MKKTAAFLFLCIICLTLVSCGSSEKHYEKAQEYIEANDRENAIGELSKAIDKDPKNEKLYVARGYAYLMPASGSVNMEDTYNRAKADFEKALSLNSNNEEAIKGLYYTELYRNNVEEAQKTIMDAINDKDISGELKSFVKDIEEGNIYDYSGHQRVKTGFVDGQMTYRMYIGYDAQGKVSFVTSYDPQGNKTGHVDTVWNGYDYSTDYIMSSSGTLYRLERTYDENHNRVTETHYDMDGAVDEEIFLEYNDHGNQIAEHVYKDGQLVGESFQSYEYDQDGRVKALYEYNNDKELMAYILYEFDEKTGNLIKEECHNANDSIRWYSIREYDEQGNCIHSAHYNGNGELEHESFSSGS